MARGASPRTRSFFVIHTHGIEGNATMGGCSFVRVRLLPTGAWPKGAHEDDVQLPWIEVGRFATDGFVSTIHVF